MNTGMINVLNVTLGMKGISEIGSKDMFSEGVSFNDVLTQRANTSITEEITANEEQMSDSVEEDTVTFEKLAKDLTEKLDNADESIVNAAIKLIQTVGKAVEVLFGAKSESFSFDGGFDTKEEKTDALSLLGAIVNFLPEKDEEDEVVSIVTDISQLLETGISDKEMSAEDVINQLMEVLDPDEDNTKLADAVMTVLCNISGVNYSEMAEDENVISDSSIGKLAEITKAAVSTISPEEKAQLISDIVNGKPTLDESNVKFAEFISKPDNMVQYVKSSIVNLKINNAAEQLDSIKPTAKSSEGTAENIINPLAQNIPVPNISIETNSAADVYSELGNIVTDQLTNQLANEISDMSQSVKELTIVLKPESLGEIAVKLVSDNSGNISLVLAASNPEIGKAVSQNVTALAESFAKQNLNVDTINVVSPSEASAYMNLDFTNQSFNRKNDGGNGENHNGRNSVNAVGEIDTADEIRAQKLLKEAKLWLTV